MAALCDTPYKPHPPCTVRLRVRPRIYHVKPERSFDEIVDVLGHQLRRQVLVELMDHDPVASRETVVESAAHDARETVIRRVHDCLPKVAAREYIAWNGDDETVVTGPDSMEIESTPRSLNDRTGLPGAVTDA